MHNNLMEMTCEMCGYTRDGACLLGVQRNVEFSLPEGGDQDKWVHVKELAEKRYRMKLVGCDVLDEAWNP